MQKGSSSYFDSDEESLRKQPKVKSSIDKRSKRPAPFDDFDEEEEEVLHHLKKQKRIREN